MGTRSYFRNPGIFLQDLFCALILFFNLSFFNLRKLINQLINFLAALGLRCCMRAFSSCGERELLFVAVCGLLIAVASLVAEHGLQSHGLQQLWHVGSAVVAHGLQSAASVVVVHRLSCSAACGKLEPVSPALAGGFLTTAPRGKSLNL